MGADDAEAADAPLSRLAREVRERRRREGEPTVAEAEDGPVDGDTGGPVGDGDPDDPFESVETPAADAEAVWATLATDADAADPTGASAVGAGSDPEAVEASAEVVREHVVPKRAYCQQCPHFSDPPEVACGHEGTAIVEVVDADSFRVHDCPVARDAAEGDADAGADAR